MKVQVLMTALLMAAGITLTAAPKVEGNIITINDKKITCEKNGDIIVSGPKGLISRTAAHYSVINPALKKTDWTVIQAKDCTMTFKDNKFTWVLNRNSFGKSWKAVDQTLEILADGRLKLTIKKYPAPEGLKLYDNAIFTVFPLTFDGTTAKYNGAEMKLKVTKAITPFPLPSVKGVKGSNYVFPLDKGSFGVSSQDTHSGLTGFKDLKNIRLTWYISNKTLTGTIFFDIK